MCSILIYSFDIYTYIYSDVYIVLCRQRVRSLKKKTQKETDILCSILQNTILRHQTMHISRKDFAIIKRTPTPLKKTLNLLIVRNSYTFIHNIILTIYITILNFIYIYISIHPFPIIKFQKTNINLLWN